MAVTTAVDENKQLVRDFMEEVFNGREYDSVSSFWADDVIQHGPAWDVEFHGVDACLEQLRMTHAGFSDLECTEEYCIAEGDLVAAYYTYTGTHDGEFMGMAPTGEEGTVTGMSLYRIEDGLIAESWIHADFLGLFEQLGVLPEELSA